MKDFIVSSIEMESVYGDVEGKSGKVDYGATYKNRLITIPFATQSNDLLDFALHRDSLFEILTDVESYYIAEKRRSKKLAYNFVDTNQPASMDNSTNNQLVGGKRYKVRLQNTFELEQTLLFGEGELVYETTELPFAESIASTQDIQRNGLRYGDGWSYGMGLLYDEESHKYTHTARTFRIYNAGNVDIHPFEQDLRIEITGASKGYELRNVTTGSVFKLTDTVNGKVVLDGANITDNNSQALRKTNRKYISLRKGWNSFTQTHTSEVKLNFHFYYK